jgi:prepilin-type N-terminal cleavage/methylation domain-containing protein
MGIKQVKVQRHSGRRSGFTLIEIMIVVLIIGILLAIAVPNFIKTRELTRNKACVENLSKIHYAKESYLMENNLPITTAAGVFTDAALYGVAGHVKVKPECPGGGAYSPNDGSTFPSCNYGGGTVHVLY